MPWSVCPSFPADIQADGTEIASCFEEKHIGQTWTIEGPITVSYGEHKANAAFIVRACNSHYQLVQAVEMLLNMPGDIDTERNPPEMQQRVLKERLEAWSFARAALSQAGGASE